MTTFENTDALASTPARETALVCLADAVEAVRPERVVADAVSLADDRLAVGETAYDLTAYDRVVVVGGGKAADGVADALEATLGDRLTAGAVVVPDPDPDGGQRIERLPGDHPVPSRRGVESTERLAALVRDADERTLVLAVVTGGASAILPSPADGVALEDLQATTDALLRAGADVAELNAVRKHLSTLKGGGLARLAAPATVVGLVLSDVVGNDLGVIASGPTAPDDSTFADALDVLDRYGVDVPDAVRERLECGVAGSVPETPGTGDPVFDAVENHVLADGFTALAAARETARERGFETCILSSRVRGESREAAHTHAAVAEEALATGNPVAPPAVVLSGGETTVTVRGDGRGGPNLEFALAAGIDVRALSADVAVAAIDSDGADGATDAAGALVGPSTVEDVAPARDALADNDALPYLDERAAVLRTGPTGTNVNDLRVVVVAGAEESASPRGRQGSAGVEK